jgi:hypothetical protein
MGKFNHDTDSLGDAVGFSEEKQRAVLDCFNKALDEMEAINDTSKSKILERTMQILRREGLVNDEHDHFFAAFFLSEIITRKLSDNNEVISLTMKTIAKKFSDQLKERGIQLDDLPLEEMIKEVKEDLANGDESSEHKEEHIKQLMALDPNSIVDRDRLLAHVESDKNDF